MHEDKGKQRSHSCVMRNWPTSSRRGEKERSFVRASLVQRALGQPGGRPWHLFSPPSPPPAGSDPSLILPYPFPEFPFFSLPSDYRHCFGLDAAGLDSRGTLAGFQRAYHSRSFLIEESFSLCGLQELGSPVAREGQLGGECLFWK